MEIKFKFKIAQQVTVLELARPGVVLSILMNGQGTQYQVRYFWDGDAKEVWFYDWEIQ